MLDTIVLVSASLAAIAVLVHVFWPFTLIYLSHFDKDHRDTLLRFTRRVSSAIVLVFAAINGVATFVIEDNIALASSQSIYFLVVALVHVWIAYLTVRFIKNERRLARYRVIMLFE